jgi:hypothetical protein
MLKILEWRYLHNFAEVRRIAKARLMIRVGCVAPSEKVKEYDSFKFGLVHPVA